VFRPTSTVDWKTDPETSTRRQLCRQQRRRAGGGL